MKVYLVDFGSTFVKYTVYNPKTRSVLLSDKLPFPPPIIKTDIRFEIASEEIHKLVDKVFSIGIKHSCEKAYICVQMHGYLLRNSENRVSNYISWRDRSGIADGIDIDFNKRGTSLKVNLPYGKFYRNPSAEGELYTLGSYIAFLLTGKNITHKTDGCASGFFDAETLDGDPLWGLKLPVLCHIIRSIGTYHGMEIYTPVGDHQISYLGSEAGDDKCLVNIGTATQISCLTSSDYPAGNYELRPYFEMKKRLITISGLTGGYELFEGVGWQKLLDELFEALKLLPPRSEIVFGGGGSELVFRHLSEELGKRQIYCTMTEKNISMEGLKMIADQKNVKIGTMLSEVAFTNFPIILKNTGIDFFIIDCEHGAFDDSVLSSLIIKAKLSGVSAIVRIGDNRREMITKLADMGASGFLLSMTNGAQDIRKVVEYAKYSPIGRRGISTTRAHTMYNPPTLKDYMKSANENMQIYAQIETVEGIGNISEILDETGVDGVFIGPNDLSDDLCCIGDTAPIKECIAKVAEASREADKSWGIITANHELLKFSVNCKVNMISCGSELNMLIDGCKKIKETII